MAYMSNLERFLYVQQNRLAECVLCLDGHFGGLGLSHDWAGGVGGDSAKAYFKSWSSVDANSQSAVSQLSLSQSNA
jgi:hypothetical protein